MLQSLLSIESVFWFPLGMDLLLLVFTYGYCKISGMEWFLEQHNLQNDTARLKKTDGKMENKEQLDVVWDFAMIAYSAYGCLLPWAAYVCFYNPHLRTSLSWAMTNLMLFKFATVEDKKKMYALMFMYFPTYGGYAIYKTFFIE